MLIQNASQDDAGDNKVHDSQACISWLDALLRVELMMRVGRIINHTFITRIAAAPYWLHGPRGIIIIPRRKRLSL